MPGCCVEDCTHSSQKGFIMKVFPRDPKRRAEWAANVGRKNWSPTNSSFLCEVHFEPSMWEHRIDGLRKLKSNAVPTLFGFKLEEHTKENNRKFAVAHQVPLEPREQSEVEPGTSGTNNINVIAVKNTKQSKDLLEKQRVEIMILKRKLKKLRDAYRKLQRESDTRLYKTKLKQIFTVDQINAICRNSNRPQQWSNETIMKALKLKFACGERGYEELRRQNIPLPGIRTLQMRLQGFQFSSGISDDIFEFLKIKVSQFEDERDKECSLIMDEMSITPRNVYDTSTHSFLGSVTLPDHVGTATHALVFMLVGIASRWKQIIGYYFTADGFKGDTLKPIILKIIQKAEAINLHVNNITSDMSPSNVGLWREFGITAGRYSATVNKIPHPCDGNRYLYILADAAHLLKNLKACILNNKFITIPTTMKEKYKLPTDLKGLYAYPSVRVVTDVCRATAPPRCLQYVHVYIRDSMHTVTPLTDGYAVSLANIAGFGGTTHFRSQEFSSGGSGVGPPFLLTP